MSLRSLCQLALVLACLWILPAAAQNEPAPPLHLDLTDAEIAARLGFLEDRFDAARPGALAWQWGWSGVFTSLFVANTIYAVRADDGDKRVRGIVDAANSAVFAFSTFGQFHDPLVGTYGAAAMRAVPGDDREAQLQRLALGEHLLEKSAKQADTRYSLRRHAFAVGANILGGIAITLLGDGKDAIQSTAVGIAVTEAHIWSQPWQAPADLRLYHATFGATPAATPATAGAEQGSGAGLQVVLHF